MVSNQDHVYRKQARLLGPAVWNIKGEARRYYFGGDNTAWDVYKGIWHLLKLDRTLANISARTAGILSKQPLDH